MTIGPCPYVEEDAELDWVNQELRELADTAEEHDEQE